MSQSQATIYEYENTMPISPKIMRSIKRIAAKRRASLYRSRQSPGSKDRRDLGRVVRSYRAANPYQITPSAGRTVTFWRKVQVTRQLNQQTGFASVGRNINFGFSLRNIFGFTDGNYNVSEAVPNASEFQQLFDYYKINAVKMQMFYSKTASTQDGNVGLGMPIMLIANDFDDIAEVMTLQSMNERVGVRYVQFDASSPRGVNHYIKPKPSNVVVQTDLEDGTQTVSTAGVVFGTQWLDCSQSNIVHNGIKIYYDNQGITAGAILGNVSFVFDIEFCFKGYR